MARLFLAMVEAMGGLEPLLDHALATWLALGRRSRALHYYRIYARDGWRCLIPGCTARRGLQAHHMHYRSHGGPEDGANLVTLCVVHHKHFVHGGLIGVSGDAPDGLVFDMGVGRFASGDVKLAGGQARL